MNRPFDVKPVSELVRYATGKVTARGFTKEQTKKMAKAALLERGYELKNGHLHDVRVSMGDREED